VHRLKQDRPQLTIELNGGLLDLETCQQQLERLDGVMVGRAAYAHPLQWRGVDRLIFGAADRSEVKASAVIRGTIPHAKRWREQGGKVWDLGRHLVHVVEGCPGARHWRAQLTQQACRRDAEAAVLEQAALQLEQRGL
jgi:tRNA-dihydrouridine synthase A